MAYAAGEDRSSFQAGGRSWSGNIFGFAKATEDTDWTDRTFAANWANLKNEGKVRGAYHFFHPASSPAAQARFFVGYVRAHGGFGPGDIFAADVEISVGEDGQEHGPDRALHRMHAPYRAHGPVGAAVGVLARQFCDEVAALVGPSCPVVIYSFLSMATAHLGACAKYPLWVADFTSRPPSSVAPWPRWTFWQNADHGGQGGGDTDRFNGDAAALRAWVGSFRPSPPLPANWTEVLVNNLPTLRAGMRDPVGGLNMVRRAQNGVAGVGRWNSLGAVTAVKDDGDFGPGTQAAVEAVQRFFGIPVTGVVDPATWKKLVGAAG